MLQHANPNTYGPSQILSGPQCPPPQKPAIMSALAFLSEKINHLSKAIDVHSDKIQLFTVPPQPDNGRGACTALVCVESQFTVELEALTGRLDEQVRRIESLTHRVDL